MKADPLAWWSSLEDYRLLWPLARMMLGIPASNTAAERLFSNAGWLAEGRENLAITTLEDLATVRHFLVTSTEADVEQLIVDLAGTIEEEEKPVVIE